MSNEYNLQYMEGKIPCILNWKHRLIYIYKIYIYLKMWIINN